MTNQIKAMTVKEFEKFSALPENRKRLLELIEGRIVEKMPTQEHGAIVIALGYYLYGYIKQHGGGIVATEVRHQLPDDPNNSRLPDVSFSQQTDPPIEKGSVPRMPDLAVEVKSPDDSYTEMREKAAYYLKHGSKLVWLIYPEKQEIEVCTLGEDGSVTYHLHSSEETLSGGEVLPGFEVAIKAIFE